jgi:hypothetical protein
MKRPIQRVGLWAFPGFMGVGMGMGMGMGINSRRASAPACP